MIEMSVNNGVNLDKEDNIKKEVVTLKQKAIADFKKNLRRICEGDN